MNLVQYSEERKGKVSLVLGFGILRGRARGDGVWDPDWREGVGLRLCHGGETVRDLCGWVRTESEKCVANETNLTKQRNYREWRKFRNGFTVTELLQMGLC